jgi:methylated-DNA-[protein]-cysteine S-methyltransferase
MKFHTSIVQTTIDSPLGVMVLAATSAGLAGAWFTDQRHLPKALDAAPDFKSVPHDWPRDDAHPTLVTAARQLAEFFAGQRRAFELTYDISGGTLFQQSVWRALLKIDHGQTSSYGQVARQINNPAAVRAVGMAVGRNPLGVIIPCHRVLGADGSLTGYAGGLHRKVWLLGHEGVQGYGTTASAAVPSSTLAKSAKSAQSNPSTPSPQALLL